MNHTSNLNSRRIQAAETSGGISNDAIYIAIQRVIDEKGLCGQLLDYGAGVGHLSRRCLALDRFEAITGADLMGCPPDLTARVRWIQQDLSESLSSSDADFDVVIAAEIIEHLENPRFTVREIFRVLKNGGWAILTTPNNESLRAMLALLFRGHFVAFTDSSYPAHITALLRKDLRRIFAESGFLEPQFFFTNEGGLPGMPSIRWQTVSLGLLRGLRFSDNIVAVAQKPW